MNDNGGDVQARKFRVGVDVGGTFTDVVLVEEASGEILVSKVHTVPEDPSQGCIAGIDKALADYGISPQEFSFIVHGTTIATNTIIEGKGARSGLITSDGFRDVLEIAYQTRPNLYDVFYDKPRPLVPRSRCLGVPERIGPDGAILVSLDVEALRLAARRLKAAGVESIAVAFLHSYRDPTHERLAGQVLEEECSGLPIVLSSEVCPEFREYPRTSTAVVNAVLLPRVTPYIERLEQRLRERKVAPELHLMTSAGGLMSAFVAKRHPVHLVESGPAAGVIGAAFVAQHSGYDNLLALDIGGTTAKAAVVNNGRPQITEQFEVGAAAIANVTSPKGLGYPVLTPVISLVEIGSGGGSIAQVDPGGALSVGPQSAGANPGPACYGRGGTLATITDANLVLGRINPDYFLGGELRLDLALAEEAIRANVAEALGMSVVEAALAIINIADAKMTSALYFISVEQGIDPRDYVLVPSGGAGPLQAVSIARALGVATVLVPPTPGLNSALGMLASDLKHDMVRTYMKHQLAADADDISTIYGEMEQAVGLMLEAEHVRPAYRSFQREIEMCYVGQSFQLKLPVLEKLDRAGLDRLIAAFHERHQDAYGFASRGEPVRLVNLRLTGIGKVPRPVLRTLPKGGETGEQAIKGSRYVYFEDPTKPSLVQLYDRSRLCAGDRFEGPAIIEQMDTTTVLPAGASAYVGEAGSLLISTGTEEREQAESTT